jgi:hypothetical protein
VGDYLPAGRPRGQALARKKHFVGLLLLVNIYQTTRKKVPKFAFDKEIVI